MTVMMSVYYIHRAALGDWQRVFLQPTRCKSTRARRLLPHSASSLSQANRRPAGRSAGRWPAVVRNVYPRANQVQRFDEQSARASREDARNLRQSHRLPASLRHGHMQLVNSTLLPNYAYITLLNYFTSIMLNVDLCTQYNCDLVFKHDAASIFFNQFCQHYTTQTKPN